jgi:hypothetical protein
MMTIGATPATNPLYQTQPQTPPRSVRQDNDGDENTESASTKASEASGKGEHKVDTYA